MSQGTDSTHSSYQDRQILITGGLGFIGLNLVRALLDAGARVKILNHSLDPLALAWLNTIARGRSVEVCQGDILDSNLISQWLPGGEVIFDLAAHSGAANSLTEASLDMQVNVAGHLNLLETARRQDQHPRIVFISSRLVYGVTGLSPVNEDHPTQPTSLYGLHKLTAEHYYRLYHLHYDIPYVILRLTNPYGPFQLPHRRDYGIVNHFIITAMRGGTLPIYAGAQQLRDYISIGDVVNALLRAGSAERALGQTLNVGYGSSISVEAMARAIVAAAGAGRIEIAPWPELQRKVETGHFICDISRIQQVLGWQPEGDLETGLKRTIQAYRELLDAGN